MFAGALLALPGSGLGKLTVGTQIFIHFNEEFLVHLLPQNVIHLTEFVRRDIDFIVVAHHFYFRLIEIPIKDILEDLFLILPHVLGNLLYVLIEFFQVSLARLDQLFLEPLAIFLALQQELRIGAFAVQV